MMTAQADEHCGLAWVGKLDSTRSRTSSSRRSGNRSAQRIGTGASRMIEPLPQARCEVFDEARMAVAKFRMQLGMF